MEPNSPWLNAGSATARAAPSFWRSTGVCGNCTPRSCAVPKKPLPSWAAACHYKRHRAIVITSNRVVQDWGKYLADATMATKRLVVQTSSRKAVGNRAKLYSWHAPEVECISKGKSRKPYEFGVKVGLAMTLKGNLIVGARSFPGNPYDGHTMHEQIEQSAILMQGLGVKPEVIYADLGYRGVDKDNPGVEIKHRGKDKRLTDEERRLLKRRQAIEPIIGQPR